MKGLNSFGALQALVTLHKEQFHEYQLQVARAYVTQAGVIELKRGIITELGRVEGRVEAQIDRLVESRSRHRAPILRLNGGGAIRQGILHAAIPVGSGFRTTGGRKRWGLCPILVERTIAQRSSSEAWRQPSRPDLGRRRSRPKFLAAAEPQPGSRP